MSLFVNIYIYIYSGNTNWARRFTCNRCQAPRPSSAGEGGEFGGGGGGGGEFGGGGGGKGPSADEGDWICPTEGYVVCFDSLASSALFDDTVLLSLFLSSAVEI